MPTAKTSSKSAVPTATPVMKKPQAALPVEPPLVLKRETVDDLQAMLKQATKARQSRKVCVA